jgi:hypothetical protein
MVKSGGAGLSGALHTAAAAATHAQKPTVATTQGKKRGEQAGALVTRFGDQAWLPPLSNSQPRPLAEHTCLPHTDPLSRVCMVGDCIVLHPRCKRPRGPSWPSCSSWRRTAGSCRVTRGGGW